MPGFKVVETDNHGRDYPDEKFLNVPATSAAHAHNIASAINNAFCQDASALRFWKVVEMPYKLEGGFKP
jgi:hypothetical protein